MATTEVRFRAANAHSSNIYMPIATTACPGTPLPAGNCLNLVKIYFVPLILTASQIRLDLKQIVDKDADFYWRGIGSYLGDGTFSIRFSINDNYYLSNVRIPKRVAFGSGSGGSRALSPEIRVPAGGKIGIEVQNLNAFAISSAILLVGVKRVPIE